MPRQPRHKVFVSYHHENDQQYKDLLVEEMAADVIDRSVEDGDIDERLRTEDIWEKIRDEHIADATVLLVLIGRDTWSRRFVDWEIGSALNRTRNNSRCGVLGIVLPTTPTTAGAAGNPACSLRDWLPTSKERTPTYVCTIGRETAHCPSFVIGSTPRSCGGTARRPTTT